MYGSLIEVQKSLNAVVREDGVWAIFQADREVGRLIERLLESRIAADPEAIAEVMVRFDIVYGRINLMQRGSFSDSFSESEEIRDGITEVRDLIEAMVPTIDSLPELSSDDLQDALGQLSDEALVLRPIIENILIRVNAAKNLTRMDERENQQAVTRQIGTAVATLVAIYACIVAMQFVQVRRMAGTSRELRELSQRNARIANEAEAANRAKSMFLATMSHEIRTPLNGIIGATELLALAPLDEENRSRLAMIRQSGDLLLDVINDVLDLSKLESGQIDFDQASFRLPDVFRAIEVIFAPRAAARGLALEFDVAPLQLTSDPARLRQVLVNLVGNAVKFTELGSIRIRAKESGDNLLLVEVEDTGIGISEAGTDLLFREFSQVDGSISRRFGGTGLGLAICKRIIEAMGGRIGVRSVPGRGSTFWFELPVTDMVAVDPSPQVGTEMDEGPELMQGGLAARPGVRILLVEDNEINRRVATGLLGTFGLQVQTACDGFEAIAALTDDTFDLVFMDMQMPRLSGLDATRRLRASGCRVPIVGLTANAFVEDRENCLASGMDDFLPKPVKRDTLQRILIQFDLLTPTDGKTAAPAAAAPADPADDDRGGADASVDLPRIDLLADEIGAETVLELVDGFADELPSLIEKASDRNATREERDDALHTIKGTGLTLGLTGLATKAQQLRQEEECDASCLAVLARPDIDLARDHLLAMIETIAEAVG